jgi:hypothetical protein
MKFVNPSFILLAVSAISTWAEDFALNRNSEVEVGSTGDPPDGTGGTFPLETGAQKQSRRLLVLSSESPLGTNWWPVRPAAASNATSEFGLSSSGARFGFSHHQGSDRFLSSEGYAIWNLPWSRTSGANWTWQCQLEMSAGWLGGRGEDGFVGRLGPMLSLGHARVPVELLGGVSPTILSCQKFGNMDFGAPLQFTSHAGLLAKLGRRMTVGYRFQHTSNAGLHRHNPGLNLHVFTIGCRF